MSSFYNRKLIGQRQRSAVRGAVPRMLPNRMGLCATALIFAFAVQAQADEPSDLRDTVEAQGKLIEELQSDLEELRKDREGAAEPVQTEESSAAPEGTGVTPEYVDERIQDFERAPESRFLIAGYGSGQYVDTQGEPSTFVATFNPGFHFRLTESLHFNAELEIGLARHGDETETEIELEFGQIDYLLNDWLVLSTGQIVVPFNVFGPRLHPQWINKMASSPPIYGGHGGIRGILPTLISDVGIMASGGAPLWSDASKFNYAVYLINGPVGEEDEPLEFEFENVPDLNDNKAVGGRIGVLPIPNLELGVSYQTGKVSETNDRYNLIGADAWYSFRGLELRGEYIRSSQDQEGSSNPNAQGYYLQAAYRLRNLINETSGWRGALGRLEPVIRWGQILDFDPLKQKQLAFGLDYWLFETAPLKFTYELNSKTVSHDQFIIQFAYGF